MFHHHGRLMFLAGLKDVSGSQHKVTFVTAAVVLANPVGCKRDNGGLTF
jgi:hypothetical protein